MARTALDSDHITTQIIAGLSVLAEYRALGVQITGEPGANGWAPCHAYGRDTDDNPSAEVCVIDGRYHDFTNGENLSLWDFAVDKAGKFENWKEARQFYADKAGVELPKRKSEADKLEFQPWNETLVGLWCLRKPPITPEAIRANGGELARYYGYTVIALPIYPDGRVLAKPCGWILWNAAGGELPVFHKDRPTTWKKMKVVAGSHKGLVGGHGLGFITKADRVWKTEGPGDMLALWAAIPRELREKHIVITNSNGCGEHPSAPAMPIFSGKLVGVVHDCDVPGQSGAVGDPERNKLGWCGAIAREAAECRNVVLPYPIAEKHGKDLRDWLGEGHTYGELLGIYGQASNVAAVAITPIEGPDDPHRLARMYLHSHRGSLDGTPIIRFWRSEWYRWQDGSYVNFPEDELSGELVGFIKEEYDRLNLIEQSETNKDPPKTRKVTRNLIADVRQALRGMCLLHGLDDPFWIGAAGPWPESEIFAARNGLVHVPTLAADNGEDDPFLPATPHYFTLNSGDWNYDQWATKPERWIGFLRTLWPDDQQSIDLLQEWFGYVLLPDLKHDKMMLLVGPKRSGKGTISTVLQNLVGSRGVVNPTLTDLCDQFAPHSLMGRTLAIVGDARLDGRRDTQQLVEILLNLTGRDPREIRRKHTTSLRDVKLHTRMMICSNELPNLKDASGALAGRALILKLTESFFNREDKRLGNALLRELPSIFMWAVKGWKRLNENMAFTEPEAMRGVQEEYRRATSPVSAFLDDRCIVGLGETIPVSTLYAAWEEWSRQNGSRPGDARQFGRNLHAAIPSLDSYRSGGRSGQERWYKGVTLRADVPDPELT